MALWKPFIFINHILKIFKLNFDCNSSDFPEQWLLLKKSNNSLVNDPVNIVAPGHSVKKIDFTKPTSKYHKCQY